MGLPVMDNNGQAQPFGQQKLVFKKTLLNVGRGVFLPIIIQPNFADGHHLWLRRKPFQLFQIILGNTLDLLRMNAHRSINVRIGFGQRNGSP